MGTAASAGLSAAMHRWRVDSGPKDHWQGTHRTCSPGETVARVRPLMPLLGITRLADVTRLDTLGMPVFLACRPNARAISVAQGKGLTPDSARASALMEALESWHAERVSLPLIRASERELRLVAPLVDTARLPRTPTSSYHDARRILWVEGVDLLGEGPIRVPYDLVHTDYTLPAAHTSDDFVMSSNGLASGNHVLEAVSHGLCEVVERDAHARWARRDAQAETRLDLATVDDPDAVALIDRFRARGLAIGVWDLTSDVGVPVFLAEIIDRERDDWRRLYAASGVGCHPERGIALVRALTEAAQSRLTLISGSRDDAGRDQYVAARDPARLAATRRRLDSPAPHPRRFQDAPTARHPTHEADVAWILGRLRSTGVDQAAAVNLTHPGLGIPVVRIVVPGLEPTPQSRGRIRAGGRA